MVPVGFGLSATAGTYAGGAVCGAGEVALVGDLPRHSQGAAEVGIGGPGIGSGVHRGQRQRLQLAAQLAQQSHGRQPGGPVGTAVVQGSGGGGTGIQHRQPLVPRLRGLPPGAGGRTGR
jgi:hypothetical protein